MTLLLPRHLRAELRCRAEASRMRGLVTEFCLVTRDQLGKGVKIEALKEFVADIAEMNGGAHELWSEGKPS